MSAKARTLLIICALFGGGIVLKAANWAPPISFLIGLVLILAPIVGIVFLIFIEGKQRRQNRR
jgi:phosphate/sulfate permease